MTQMTVSVRTKAIMKVTIHLSLKHGGVPVTNKKNSLYSKKGKYEFVIMCINGLPQDGGGGDKQPQEI